MVKNNAETLKQEIEEDRLDMENDSDEENTYQIMVKNYFLKINLNFNTLVMEQWSMLSNVYKLC